MSPSSREVGGVSLRPSSLKVHKDSHQIHKLPSSNPNAISPPPASVSSTTAASHHHQPVIIYTHSPKVIHTQARDFMALVQRLTGLSSSSDESDTATVSSPKIKKDLQKKEPVNSPTANKPLLTEVASGTAIRFDPLLLNIPGSTTSELYPSRSTFYKYADPTAPTLAHVGGLISPTFIWRP
ncbi:Protein MKS1 [Apostasia shenzhenica]|uniref:Protein MKS1 n=1 Tax=Apostasia shenzhenica TaxID=1088818 RepID=A0A2I0AF35_9ASPA|nr:Protein MKS1 [Apostasia shenzhenica]